MNKYQEILLSNLNFIMCSMDELSDISQIIRARQGNEKKNVEFDKNQDTLVINQYDDITITKYALVLRKPVVKALNNIYVLNGSEWEEIFASNIDTKNSFGSTFGYDNPQAYIIPVDFNTKLEKIKLTFINNIADDYIIKLNFLEADKEKYYAQKEQERKDGLLSNANIKVSTGIDLVNIYFQPCCEEYHRTEIILYRDNMMLAKYKVNEEMFFHSISGLAFGKYEFILKQYDDKGNIILETDKRSFSLSVPNYSGRHTITI